MDRITAEWVPALDNSGRGSIDDASFAPDESQATYTVDVPCFASGFTSKTASELYGDAPEICWNIHKFIAQALGYTKRPSPGVLSRWPPARHPIHPQLRATKITRIEGIKEKSRVLSPLSMMNAVLGKPPIYVQVYQWYRITILFQSLTYNVLEDYETATERNRYVTTTIQATADILNREGGTFTFLEGEGAASGKPFRQPIGLIRGMYDMVLTWHQLPREAVFEGEYPVRVESLLGRVNDDAVAFPYNNPGAKILIGTQTYAAGNLLLTAAVITPEQSPIAPQIMGVSMFDTPRTYRIEWHVSCDPKGHNLKPFPGDQQWHRLTHNGLPPGLGGKTIYETCDWNLLFTPL